ncbi:AraC family transcriptional regulator [Kosakonia oryzendophytica]|uniref:AraC family transcriptional regulator n=1 Tax=Kosakonia oryzendophytica TaxID=1005665 RepID=UPI003D3359EC
MYEGRTVYLPRRQPWGKLGFAENSVMEFTVEGKSFLSPPGYATWIPAGALHCCNNHRQVKFYSVYLDPEYCIGLPESSCTLKLSPLIRAIFTDFSSRSVAVPETDEDKRLALVLIDQLNKSPRCDSFLPVSDDDFIIQLTLGIRSNPGDRKSLSDWAALMNTTEKTLSRRFQSQIGMTYNEWRQRMKLVASLSMLEQGMPVHQISTELNYSSPSAFIAMFRRLTGDSPSKVARNKL